MTSVKRLQDLPIQQYLELSCLHFYASDLLRLLSQDEAANGAALACSYFCAVAKGQHVVGREFGYISLTLWNRQSFLHAAKAIFEQTTSQMEGMTLQDLHSMLVLLCPDIPVRVARSAFKAATPLLPSGASAPHPFGDTLKLSFQKLWNSLEVTFLYEHFLLELRHLAFEGKSHMLKTAADVANIVQPACEIVERSGWPCIPQTILQEVMQQTANAIEPTASFHFDALVRGLCTSASVQVHCQAVRAQASVKRHNARATLDSALQSLIQNRMPLEDQTNLPARPSSCPATAQALLNIVSFRVDDNI